MQDKDKQMLAHDLWERGGRVLVPITELASLTPEFPSMKRYEAEIDFRTETVKVPAISLSFDDVRKIWESIVLYGEVS